MVHINVNYMLHNIPNIVTIYEVSYIIIVIIMVLNLFTLKKKYSRSFHYII